MKIRFEVWDKPKQWAWEVDGEMGCEGGYYSWVEPRRPYPDDRWESAMAWLEQYLAGLK